MTAKGASTGWMRWGRRELGSRLRRRGIGDGGGDERHAMGGDDDKRENGVRVVKRSGVK